MYIALDRNVHPVYIDGVMHLADYMAGKNPDGRRYRDEEVAEGIRRSRVTVSRIRRKKVRPDWATMLALEKFTGGLVTPNDFAELPADAEVA